VRINPVVIIVSPMQATAYSLRASAYRLVGPYMKYSAGKGS
jgi:hypothetical protein